MDRQPDRSLSEDLHQLEALRRRFPDYFSGDKQADLDKLLAACPDAAEERYEMRWPGKRLARQSAHLPPQGRLVEDPSLGLAQEQTQDLCIEGDNLEVLKILQAQYHGRIRMIYIDPPYNTGNAFLYPDRFGTRHPGRNALAGQEQEALQHSAWMNMIYPRLLLARDLLSPEGAIFISISDAELDNLRKICHEIFGEANFVAQLIWENREGGGGSDSRHFRIKHEYILCYARDRSKLQIRGVGISNPGRYSKRDAHEARRGPYYLQKLNQASIRYSTNLDYPIIAPDGTMLYPLQGSKRACWRWSREKLDWGLAHDFIEFRKDRQGKWQVYSKQYLLVDNEDQLIERSNRPSGVIHDFSSTQGSKELESLLGGRLFPYPKPLGLMRYLLSLMEMENEYLLDFFAGSGSSGHAALELQAAGIPLHFILVQMAEPTPADSAAFARGFRSISEITAFRLQKAIELLQKQQSAKEHPLGFRFLRLQ